MGRCKLSIPLHDGGWLGGLALREILRSKLDRVYIVTKDDEPAWLTDALSSAEAGKLERTVVKALHAEAGMSHSIRSGLRAAAASGADAVVIMLADQPFVTREHLNRLIACFSKAPSLHYVASNDGGGSMPPILIASSLFPELMKLEGDKGARELLRQSRFRGETLMPFNPLELADIDTEEELAELKALTGWL